MTEQEFEDIVPSLRPRILSVARGFGLGDESEDVAQDAMLKLWNLREQLDARRPIAALATCMARQLAIDCLRRRHTVPLNTYDAPASRTTLPDEQLESKEDTAWLEAQMERLPSTEHTILRLRQVERRSTEEIAAIVGISPASVTPLLSRARRHLLEQLKQRNKT